MLNVSRSFFNLSSFQRQWNYDHTTHTSQYNTGNDWKLEKIEKKHTSDLRLRFSGKLQFWGKTTFQSPLKIFQMVYQHVEGIQRVVQLYLFQTVTKLWSYDTYITIHSRKCENTLENPSSQGTAVPICSKLSQVAKWRFFWNIPKIL